VQPTVVLDIFFLGRLLNTSALLTRQFIVDHIEDYALVTGKSLEEVRAIN
jgi:hypothetical protein